MGIVDEIKLAWIRLDGRNGHEAGRQLLAELYREKTGKDCPAVLTTSRGKPYFENDRLHFSISHTKKHAFCVLADRPVGIDAEEQDRDIDLRLAEKILSPAEKERYDRAEDQRRALLKLWVLKEAEAKMTGRGLQGYPNQTDFSPEDERVQLIDGCYVAIIEKMDN